MLLMPTSLDSEIVPHQRYELVAIARSGQCRHTLRVIELSAWAKALEQARLLIGRDADPGVPAISRCTFASGAPPRETKTRICPVSVNLMALLSRLTSTCVRRSGSPTRCCGHVAVEHEMQLQPSSHGRVRRPRWERLSTGPRRARGAFSIDMRPAARSSRNRGCR